MDHAGFKPMTSLLQGNHSTNYVNDPMMMLPVMHTFTYPKLYPLAGSPEHHHRMVSWPDGGFNRHRHLTLSFIYIITFCLELTRRINLFWTWKIWN